MRRRTGGELMASVMVPLLAALLVAGCATERDGAPAAGTGPDRVDDAVCLHDGPFATDGAIPLAAAGDHAAVVTGLRWHAHEGCERFVIDIGAASGAAADGPGDVRAELLRSLGLVRLTLRDVDDVEPEATDTVFDGRLASRAFTVRSPDGQWVFVDLHLAAPARAHVALLRTPARIVVDLQPGGGPLPVTAVAERRTVVLRPRPGPASYPLEVTGYARTFEANVVARLERGGVDVSEQFTTATSWLDTWGHFTLTISSGPAGPVTLHVGDYSARDGTWEGARIELVMGG
jgi:hypothetical protein